MVVQARAEATRRRIIDAAIALFSEEGYGDTGLAAIMDRADVSKGAFYYHFESRKRWPRRSSARASRSCWTPSTN